jgi:hypothetical protein
MKKRRSRKKGPDRHSMSATHNKDPDSHTSPFLLLPLLLHNLHCTSLSALPEGPVHFDIHAYIRSAPHGRLHAQPVRSSKIQYPGLKGIHPVEILSHQ